MKLVNYIDPQKLAEHVNRGYVTVRNHDKYPLQIYSYGRKAIYDNLWNEVTCKTRGLIVHGPSNEIIARPFEKFFNYDTAGRSETFPRNVENTEKLYGPPIFTEKVNGCLGTLWTYGIHWGIATKGSFHSPHAEWATKWMENHINEYGRLVFPDNHTAVFEIICQDIQPHVIKYPEDKLVLLALINKEIGEEVPYESLCNYARKNKLERTGILPRLTVEEALKLDYPYFEGLVGTYNIPNAPPLKLKFKFPTFLENRKKFYAALKARDEAKELADGQVEYNKIHSYCADVLKEALVQCTERKEFVVYFDEPPHRQYKAILIAMLDTNSEKYKELIWKLVKEQREAQKFPLG